MSIRVLLRDKPARAIALVTPTHALVFRHSQSTADAVHNGSLSSLQSAQSRSSMDAQAAPRCMVEFTTTNALDLSDYRTLSPLPVHGTLGLITLGYDVFLCVVAGASKVAAVRPGETIERIHAVEFYCLNSSQHDSIMIDEIDPYDPDPHGQNLSRRDPALEHPCLDLQKLLSNGSFYYSTDFDLTNRLQDRPTEVSEFDIDNFDESFLWNAYMIKPLVNFRSQLVSNEREALDASRILTSATRGFVLTITIPLSSAPVRTTTSGKPSSLTLISRLSCRRAGTRFNSRGIDDDGNVANFVESETVFWSPSGLCFSYVQVRGSVPVFWEQAAGLLPTQQKITITRSKEGTQPAFDKHFHDLEQSYGAVHVINLLSETKVGEAELTGLYRYGIRHCALNQNEGPNAKDHQLLQQTEFDFHAETKGPEGYAAASTVRRLVEESADGFAYYLSEEVDDAIERSGPSEKRKRRPVVVLQQEGVFRTNCLDCLDRTNLIQTIISQMALESFLEQRGERASADFWTRHSSLWADNGDALSRIYAGTGALKSSFTRHGKMSIAGALADARKSATRLYMNNFADKGRQNTMDVLLGRLHGQTPVHLYDPINDYVTAELNRRSAEYSSTKLIKIWVGSYNLNGRTAGIDDDLSEWFFPNTSSGPPELPEIFVVGFQEIVELSPQQIMNSDPTIKQAWERAVKRTLNRVARSNGGEEYLLLRSGQLVGAALCIFVRASVLKLMKNVEGSLKKTGMSGMAGNKGAVAIRMDYADTAVCFVTAHLAAGFANYDERNKDYHTIHDGLRFQRNRRINNHDVVIWLGDFNYRIGMEGGRVKALIKDGSLQTLYENDQAGFYDKYMLNIQMVAGLAFPHYSESRITFMPTYRYDIGSDRYDTSEKARIPAWTDRILRKGSNLRQTAYGTVPLRFSDHRPVYASFECTVSIINANMRDSLSREIYAKRRADVGNRVASAGTEESDDEDIIGYDPIEPGLPPASSDRRKWWLDSGLPARSIVQPQRGAMPNPNRPSNPFGISDEPDWIPVSKLVRNDTSQSISTITSASSSEPRGRAPGPRKLPPPFELAIGSPIDDKGITATKNVALASGSTSPMLRRTSSSASQFSLSKKPPPPVAKKPAHLVASTTETHSPSPSPKLYTNGRLASAYLSSPRSMNGVQTEFPPPPKSVTEAFNQVPSGPQPPPRRSMAGVQTDFPPPPRTATDSSMRAATQAPPPPPQPRRPAAGISRAAAGSTSTREENWKGTARPPQPPRPPIDLLGDEVSGSETKDLKGWEVLQPS